MQAPRTEFSAGAHRRATLKLEDLGFGATLAGMAAALTALLLPPALQQGAALAAVLQWVAHCAAITRTIAAAALGFAA